MSNMDAMNACFEAVGAVLVWGNVRTLLRDRHVAGVNLSVSAFYVCYGAFSLAYYWSLSHWWSLAGNVGIFAGNSTWLILALWYSRKA